MTIKELVNIKYKELLSAHPKWNPIQMSNALQDYCYNDIGISNNQLWNYIDNLTGFYDY